MYSSSVRTVLKVHLSILQAVFMHCSDSQPAVLAVMLAVASLQVLREIDFLQVRKTSSLGQLNIIPLAAVVGCTAGEAVT